MGLRGHRELGHACSRTSSSRTENLIGKEGEGLKIALTTLNTGRLALPAICVGVAKWATKIAREFVRRARPVGPAGRQARRGRAEDRLHRRARRSASRRCSTSSSPARRRQEERHPHRGGDREALRLRAGWKVVDELMQIRGGRGYETAESLRGARREAGARRAGAARHADQPHLRGLDRDHAPADRPRGRRPAPRGRRRRSSRATARCGDKAKAAVGAGKFYAQVAAAAGRRRGPEARLLRRVRVARQAPALRRAQLAQARPLDLLRDDAATRPSSSSRQAFLGRIVDIGAELFAIASAVVYADTIQREQPGARASRRSSSPTSSARRPAAAPTRSSPSCGPTTTTPTTQARDGRPRRPLRRGSRRASSTPASDSPLARCVDVKRQASQRAAVTAPHSHRSGRECAAAARWPRARLATGGRRH